MAAATPTSTAIRHAEATGKWDDPDYGWGPNEYQPLGDLADFEYTDKYCKILEKWLEECD